MLLRRVFIPLGLKHLQRINQFFASLAWLNDSIHISTLGGDIGIGETLAEFLNLFFAYLLHGCSGAFQFSSIDDIDGAFRPHHCDLGGWPGKVHVSTNM